MPTPRREAMLLGEAGYGGAIGSNGGSLIARIRCTASLVPSRMQQKSVQRQRTRTANDEGNKRRQIEQGRLIAGLTEMRPSRIDGQQLNRAEPVRQMHREDGREQHNRHRYARERDEGAYKNSQTAEQL